jgi:RNA polymerase sigma factor (sigma-70 family)
MAMTGPTEVERALAEAHRKDWGLVLAATACSVRDLDLAEECVQEAYAAALVSWARTGIPDNPSAWLTTTAKRRAIDVLRRQTTLRLKMPLLVEPTGTAEDEVDMAEGVDEIAGDAVPDERLRLIFMCCHPALPPEAQLGLTLRLVCGLSTTDIARALLVPEPTMAARLTRAKRKISAARIPVRTPSAPELPVRLQAVLGVVHLVFTAGHTAPSGQPLMRTDLADKAIHLARVLRDLMPDEDEVRGLLALLLVIDARRSTRTSANGRLLPLSEQDRSLWDQSAIAEAHDLIMRSLRGGRPGRYVLQAAIASLHAEAPTFEETDWPQILLLYDALLSVWPSPVVALNRAVALSMVSGPNEALAEVEQLEIDGRLAGYQYLPAIKADLLRKLGRPQEAAEADRRAWELAGNEVERQFLAARLGEPAPRGS